MSGSIDIPVRYAAFLSALRDTANVTLAFEQSGVNRSWGYWRRRRDAAFAVRWDAVLGEARAALGIQPRVQPTWEGAPLVLTGGWGSKTRRLRRAFGADFTDARKRLFLATLHATCNVSAAARAAGVETSTAQRHRHMNTGFRQAWTRAIDEGRMHLEYALLGAGLAMLDPDPDNVPPPIDACDIRGMDAHVALQTLRLHTPSRRANWNRQPGVKVSSPEEALASVRRLAAVITARHEPLA